MTDEKVIMLIEAKIQPQRRSRAHRQQTACGQISSRYAPKMRAHTTWKRNYLMTQVALGGPLTPETRQTGSDLSLGPKKSRI